MLDDNRHHLNVLLTEKLLSSLEKSNLIQLVLQLQAANLEAASKSIITSPSAPSLPEKAAEITIGKALESKSKKNPRACGQNLDWSKYPRRHIALKFAYLGWNYHGYASQPGVPDTIEVQHSHTHYHIITIKS